MFNEVKKMALTKEQKVYLLIDELDQVVAEDNFDLHKAAERGKRYQAIYRPMFLANVFRVIGVSGTLT